MAKDARLRLFHAPPQRRTGVARSPCTPWPMPRATSCRPSRLPLHEALDARREVGRRLPPEPFAHLGDARDVQARRREVVDGGQREPVAGLEERFVVAW